MNAVKQTIRDFTSKSGQHETTVHSSTAPAVKHETVKPTKHEKINTAVDQEVHEDHYHTSVQPVHDREVLPEQHHHNVAAVQHNKHDHRDHDKIKQTLNAEAAKFKDQRVVEETTQSQSANPTVVGEHRHHHIHETVQPVVHKETIEPHVVHTTVPVHETHHKAAQHHGTTVLPAVNMTDYKSGGGVLGGEKDHSHHLPGQPQDHGGLSGAIHNHKHDNHHHQTGMGRDGAQSNDLAFVKNGQTTNTTGTTHNSSIRDTQTKTKPSLLDKLNPTKDADGNGKAGFMN